MRGQDDKAEVGSATCRFAAAKRRPGGSARMTASAFSADNVSRLAAYLRDRFEQVPGWCRPEALVACLAIRQAQARLGVMGGAFEIGAHAGRFFAGLALIVGPAERSVAIDIFAASDLRLDQSGVGAEQARLAGLLADVCADCEIEILALDSLSLGPTERQKLAAASGGFAFVSVDGGHTPEHAYADFETAEAVVAPGGVVMVDDYYSARWPGVHEGVCRHFFARRPRVAPFAFFARKLWLTTHAHHAAMMQAMQRFAERPALDAKPTTMFGYPTLAIDIVAPTSADALLMDLFGGARSG
jgi:hypothetical protein